MNRFGVLLLVISFMGVSCSSSVKLLDESIQKEIPEDAKEVILTSKLSTDSLYEKSRILLIKNGFSLVKSDKQLNIIATDRRNIGNKTEMRMSILIDSIPNGQSRLIARAEWRPRVTKESEGAKQEADKDLIWRQAGWLENLKAKRAFAFMVEKIVTLPKSSVNYN